MSQDPYVGTIIGSAGILPIRDWKSCSGQLLDIHAYNPLFSLIGTAYGGDGRSDFALPDLRGRTPISQGHGGGLSSYHLGQRGGEEYHSLSEAAMAPHNHDIYPGYAGSGGNMSPNLSYPSDFGQPVWGDSPHGNMAPMKVANSGGGEYHENRSPYITIHWLICVQGLFPSRP